MNIAQIRKQNSRKRANFEDPRDTSFQASHVLKQLNLHIPGDFSYINHLKPTETICTTGRCNQSSIYKFCMILSVNSDYFLKHNQTIFVTVKCCASSAI